MAVRVLVGCFFSLMGIVAFCGANSLDKMRSDFNARYFKTQETQGMSEYIFMGGGIVFFLFGLCILVGLVSV